MRLGLDAGQHTFDLAVEYGIKGVPISADRLAQDGIEATLSPLRERGLVVCQIGAFGYNPLSTDRERQAKQAALLKQVIPIASETGCPYIVICGGNYHPSGFGAGDARNFTDQALDEVARALAPLLALAEEHGVNLSIEPYLKTAIHSPERFLALQERVRSPALRCNIDPTSLYTYWDLWDPRETVHHVCTALAGHYGLAHVKEVALAEGFHIHAGLAPLGTGMTDWSQMLRLMAPYLPEDSWVILEHVQTPDEARSSLGLLRVAADAAGVTLT
ncbi:MAG: sugar phosphate isomerase/epimerase [Anaerolineae bacterium]|nr:sugar phosphate isomerase/epimerase [Anaerolineae bacterium]